MRSSFGSGGHSGSSKNNRNLFGSAVFFFHKLYRRIFRVFYFNRLVQRGKVPELQNVLIETTSVCNRSCSWCPVSKSRRPPGKMNESLFKKIIFDLVAIDFRGSIGMHFYNEPLIDKRLPNFLKFTRENLPHAKLYVNTNGDLLDLKKLRDLFSSGLDYVQITQYDGRINPNINEIYRNLDSSEKEKFIVHVFKDNLICNRGGSFETKKKLPLKERCFKPFLQMCINYSGKVVLCCNDYSGKVVTGGVSENSILSIWSCETFQKYREKLIKKDRGSLPLCNKCDITKF